MSNLATNQVVRSIRGVKKLLIAHSIAHLDDFLHLSLLETLTTNEQMCNIAKTLNIGSSG